MKERAGDLDKNSRIGQEELVLKSSFGLSM
jgi:hypothetical protein